MSFPVGFTKHEELKHVSGNFTIWRYMNHRKLEKLVKNSSLWFSLASEMSDKYELTIPEQSIQAFKRTNKYQNKSKKSKDSADYDFYWENEPNKKNTLINCWSKDVEENYALWKIYLGGEIEGVAIKTTVGNLRRSLENKIKSDFSEKIILSLGDVKYSHYIKYEDLNPISIITTKKPFYKFENEIRLFSLDENYDDSILDAGAKGLNIPVDLDYLINEIYISPFASLSYQRKVESLFRSKGNFKSKIKQSGIWDS